MTQLMKAFAANSLSGTGANGVEATRQVLEWNLRCRVVARTGLGSRGLRCPDFSRGEGYTLVARRAKRQGTLLVLDLSLDDDERDRQEQRRATPFPRNYRFPRLAFPLASLPIEEDGL